MSSDETKRRIPWADIRAAFEGGETNVSELSRRFGVKRESIIKHRDRDGWTRPGQIVDTVTAKVIDIATRKAVEQMGAEGLEQAASNIAADLAMHSELAKLLMEASRQTIQDYKAGKIQPSDKQNMADVFNSVVAGVKNAVHTSREINGLRSGQSSSGENEDGPRKLLFEIAELPEEEQQAS